MASGRFKRKQARKVTEGREVGEYCPGSSSDYVTQVRCKSPVIMLRTFPKVAGSTEPEFI